MKPRAVACWLWFVRLPANYEGLYAEVYLHLTRAEGANVLQALRDLTEKVVMSAEEVRGSKRR